MEKGLKIMTEEMKDLSLDKVNECRQKPEQILIDQLCNCCWILNANDQELNRWCSLRKTCMFRSEKEELCVLKNYKVKAQNVRKKKEVLSSVYSEEDKETTEAKTKLGKKRRDRLKNADKQITGAEEASMDSAEETFQALNEALDNTEEGEEILVPKKKKKLEEQTKDTAEQTAEKRKEGKNRTAWSKKKPRRLGGRLQPGTKRVKIGGREFSRQRLKAYTQKKNLFPERNKIMEIIST
ncbi:protein KRI1 homolog [Cyprinodon tularosa]|uniref:protein KRI1 homolog n=1 Tax=Cyprinodon tularosa TaxID=77115 RepID=UPI0018E20ED4|nr:protein KRI1 homolog [Cyprinodon tularosa]